MKKRQLMPKSSISRMLEDLCDKAEEIHFSLTRPGLVVKFGYDGAREYLWRQDEIQRKRSFNELKKKKLIHVQQTGEILSISFSDQAVIEYLRLKIIKSKMLPDGIVCMVVFDIPESQARIRRQLRVLLSNASFTPIQKSVWISKSDASDILMRLFIIQGKDKWIRVFNAEEKTV